MRQGRSRITGAAMFHHELNSPSQRCIKLKGGAPRRTLIVAREISGIPHRLAFHQQISDANDKDTRDTGC